MNSSSTSYNLVHLGNSAILIDFGQHIDPKLNEYVVEVASLLNQKKIEGILDIAPAYASFTVFYELSKKCNSSTVENWLKNEFEDLENNPFSHQKEAIVHTIPTIYDGQDLLTVAQHCGMNFQEVIELHCSVQYRVYMLGFLPGFAYLGGLDERLKIDRLAKPRLKVPAGSVAIAGTQTGIYSVESPGGWQIIGRTEKQLFNRQYNPPNLLQAGDYVQFMAI
jgi:inhibitor of KinA